MKTLSGTVLLLQKPNNNRDRRSAFIEYYNHVCAAYSIMKMSDPNFKLDGIAPRVEWAKPNVQVMYFVPLIFKIY